MSFIRMHHATNQQEISHTCEKLHQPTPEEIDLSPKAKGENQSQIISKIIQTKTCHMIHCK